MRRPDLRRREHHAPVAVAVERNRLPFKSAHQKVRDPALIFIIYLMRSVNAAHAKYHRGQAKRPSVVDDILVCGTFGTALRAV